jgi:hypothetical protein
LRIPFHLGADSQSLRVHVHVDNLPFSSTVQKKASPHWHHAAVVAEPAGLAFPLLVVGQVVSAIRLDSQGGGLTNGLGRALHLSFDTSKHIVEKFEHHT